MGFSGCEFIFFSCTLPSPLKYDETVLELDLKTHTFNVTEASCEMPVPSAFALMRKKETRSWRHLAANPLGTISSSHFPVLSPLALVCESILQLRQLLGLVGPLIFEFPFESLFAQHEIIFQRKKKKLHSTFVLRAMHSWALKHYINLLFFFLSDER